MSYKRILLSLGTIAVVAAVSAGVTGAFFTSTAESQGNEFNSGSLNLELNLDENNDGYSDSFGTNQTPGYNGLTPGGDEANLSATLQNVGDSDSEAVGLSVNHTNNPNGLAEQMRITELSWKGENLLENAAGADFSNYEGPSESDCDVIVGSNNADESTVQAGVNTASSGDLVCVQNGTYTESVDIATSDITLQSLNGPNSATIEANVGGLSGDVMSVISLADTPGVTINGFTIQDANPTSNFDDDSSEAFGVLAEGASDNFTLRNSIVRDIYDPARATGVGINPLRDDGSIETLANPVVANNEFTDIQTTKLNPTRDNGDNDSKSKAVSMVGDVQDAEIINNTISNIGDNQTSQKTQAFALNDTSNGNGPQDFSIRYNDFSDIAAEEFDVLVYVTYQSLDDDGEHEVRFNNLGNDEFSHLLAENLGWSSGDTKLDAQYNYWGSMTGPTSAQISSGVDTSNFLGAPHIGFVNGTDNNNNGFADLADLQADSIANATPGLSAGSTGELDFTVQLDGPTTGNNYQSSNLESDFTFTLGQVAN